MLNQDLARHETQANDAPGRTRIEDLSEIGYELTDEDLQLAVGGALPTILMPSAGTCTDPGACDDD